MSSEVLNTRDIYIGTILLTGEMPPHRKLLAYYGIVALAHNVSAFVSPSSSASCNSRKVLIQHDAPTIAKTPRHRSSTKIITTLSTSDNDDDSIIENPAAATTNCWNPNVRKQLAFISSLGIFETAYLTYDKIQYSASGGTASTLVGALCSATENGGSSSCNDVLHGPYASLHFGGINVPLSALGMAAYTMIFVLSVLPLLGGGTSDVDNNNNGGEVVVDGGNRIALLGGTTLMASFSIYLVSLLVGVIHASCLFCFASAGLSITLAGLSWFSGMLPDVEEGKGNNGSLSEDILELRKKGVMVGASSVGFATVMALGLFLGVTVDTAFESLASTAARSSAADSGTLLASTSANKFQDNVPPAITTKSSASALTLASDLKSLDSRMYGAFWCSHCYDQKQSFGYEAMQYIPYVECDREGYNNKREICREREVPGYPTWEIGGELFPGERSLDELREIVDDIKSGK